jgi:protein TonB
MAGDGCTGLFGAFVEVRPAEGFLSSAGREGRGAPPAGPRQVFDGFILTGESVAGKRQCATLPCSVALHAAAAVALIAVPLLLSSELPGAPGAVQAFFVQPMLAPPPPPPPPPPAPAARPAPRVAPAPVAEPGDRLVAPVEVPSELRPEEGLDLGIEGGVPGGVAGGVPGGVVGGVVGGLPDAPAVAPPPLPPVRVGAHIKEPVKIRHVDPVYPKVAREALVEGIVIIEAVIDPTGHIAEARILRGVPILDAAALEAVRQWEYTPTLLDGIPTPVKMTITVTFRFKRPYQS